MAAKKRDRRKKSSSDGPPNIEAVVAAVRSLWSVIEQAQDSEKPKLKQEIIESIRRLKSRIDKRPVPDVVLNDKERTPTDDKVRQKAKPEAVAISVIKRFPEPALRIYAKDLAEHALKQLPKLADCRTIDEVRSYLTDNLRFNSQATRRRNANYLINRYFPGEVVHPDVAPFAAAVEGRPALGDALFYLTCRTEKIVALVAEQIVFPSLAMGGVSRSKIRDFVQAKFPNSKSAMAVGVAVVGTYQSFGVANATRTKLNVSLREGSLAAFAYVLHLEFPEPGMHSFKKMLDGPMHKWLLWDQQWMIRQLYVLREAGVMSKVSEIDGMQQFTTKYSLADAMQPIVDLARELPA